MQESNKKNEGKCKSSEIVDIDDEENNETNDYKGIIGEKDYLKYCMEQMKTASKKTEPK